MRWSTLPVSVAVHAAVLVLFLIALFAADLDLPTSWSGSARYVAVSAAPAPPVERPRPVAPTSIAAPREAPDHIENRIEDVSSPAAPVEGGLPTAGPLSDGVPDGLIGDVMTPAPLPAVAARPQPVRVGGAIREPRKIAHVPAEYPEIARLSRIEGLVIVEATIDERGFVVGARVLRSRPLLDAAALTAVTQWRYTPTLLNGVPVPVLMTITFNFKLGDRVP